MILLKYKVPIRNIRCSTYLFNIVLWLFLKIICIDKSIVITKIFESLNHYFRQIICSSFKFLHLTNGYNHKTQKYSFEFWLRYIEIILIKTISFIIKNEKEWFLFEKQEFVSS